MTSELPLRCHLRLRTIRQVTCLPSMKSYGFKSRQALWPFGAAILHMPEWPKGAVCKAAKRKLHAGSNPVMQSDGISVSVERTFLG